MCLQGRAGGTARGAWELEVWTGRHWNRERREERGPKPESWGRRGRKGAAGHLLGREGRRGSEFLRDKVGSAFPAFQGPSASSGAHASGFPASGNEDGVRGSSQSRISPDLQGHQELLPGSRPHAADGDKQMHSFLLRAPRHWGLSVTSSGCLFSPRWWRLPEGRAGVPLSSVSTQA